MKEINIISHYCLKTFDSMLHLFTSPLGISIVIPVVSVVALSPENLAIYILIALSGFDFITGIGASYVEKKEAEKTKPELKDQSLISSEKMKLSLLKAILFAGGILCVKGLEIVFLVKPISFSMLQNPISISLITIGFCCAVEFYSIFFENFKRMGIDIVAMVKKIVGTSKEIKDIL